MKLQVICFIVTVVCTLNYASGHGKDEHHLPMVKLEKPKPAPIPQVAKEDVATCYQGYTLMSDGTCVKEIVEEPLPAEGDITVPYMIICPAGFEAVNGECVATSEVPLAYFCPVGFDDDGMGCSKSTPGEVVTQCETGELINNVCVLKEKAPHLVTPKCPDGSRAEADGNCWKVIGTFDCTPSKGKEEPTGRVIVSPRSQVPLGKRITVTKGKQHHGKLRALHPQKPVVVPTTPPLPYMHPSKHSVTGLLVGKEHPLPQSTLPPPLRPTACPTKELVSVTPPLPTRVGVVSQMCEKKAIVDAIAIVTCPPGFEDFGEACLKQTTVPPTQLCLSNGSTEGACPPVVQKVPKIVQCSNGQPAVNGRCINLETAPSNRVCPENFKDTGNGCTAKVRSGGLECRPGLTLVGNRCVGTSKRPSVAVTLKSPPACENKY